MGGLILTQTLKSVALKAVQVMVVIALLTATLAVLVPLIAAQELWTFLTQTESSPSGALKTKRRWLK